MLMKCQSKIGDFCAARDAERDELLRDLEMHGVAACPPPARMHACSSHPQPLQVPAYQQVPAFHQQPGISTVSESSQ